MPVVIDTRCMQSIFMNSGVTGPKFTNFHMIINAVNMPIGNAILQSVSECQSKEYRWVGQFCPLNWLLWQRWTSGKKPDRSPTRKYLPFCENWPVDLELIGLQGIIKTIKM